MRVFFDVYKDGEVFGSLEFNSTKKGHTAYHMADVTHALQEALRTFYVVLDLG